MKFKSKLLLFALGMSLAIPISACSKPESTTTTTTNNTPVTTNPPVEKKEASTNTKVDLKGKKVLWVDSYKEDYAWRKDLTPAIKGVLDPTGIDLKIYRMDTKNNPAEDFKKKAGDEAKKIFDEFKPDAVIINDDNAMKYFVVPYLKNNAVPVSVIGVNWSGKAYELPFSNTTGLYEVQPVKQAIDQMTAYAKGSKIAYLSSDNESAKIDAGHTKTQFNITFTSENYCSDFADWKVKYEKLQTEADMILWNNTAGIKNWDAAAAKEFILKTTKIPSASCFEWVTPFTLVGVTTAAEEHGKFAAEAAVKLLNGEKIANMPFENNKQGNLFLNKKVAEKLGITFKPEILKGAKIIE